MFKIITGTFLDGIACDIPGQNWGRMEWARQFDVFKEMGMDMVIIIRVGNCDQAMYDSRVIRKDIFDPDDRVALLLDEARRVNLQLYMGLYDGCKYYEDSNWRNWAPEIAINLELIDELRERYGKHPAFYGWYLCHEPSLSFEPWNIWNPLAAKMRKCTPGKPVIVSPRYEGRKWVAAERRTPEMYADFFDRALNQITERIDAAAFMDGHVGIGELADYAEKMKPVLDKHSIAYWSNLETFDRDMPINFPPIDWLKMRTKLEAVQPYVSKIITFEAPHFLSPYSMWDSGRMLYQRYLEYIKQKKEFVNR